MLRMLAGVLVLCAVVGLAGPSQALTFSVTVTDGMMMQSQEVEAILDPNGVYVSDPNAASDLGMMNRWMFTEFDVSLNPDPVISHSFNIVNTDPNSASSTFTITVTAPIAPLATTVTGGSGQGGVTDVNGDGATLGILSGSAFYTALIDGSNWQQLYDDPNDSISVGPSLSDFLSPTEDFGTPIPSLAGPAVSSSIGLRFNFDLTSGDRATGSGVFVVELPEPSTFLLLGFGLVGVAAFRRSH